jgi:peptide/nickel transport system permease protein
VTRYLLRRLAVLVVSLLLAMAVIFALLRLLPGNPANALLSVNATPQQIAAAQAQVGAAKPLGEQFVNWFGNMLTLNLGESFVSSLPVGPEIVSRLVVTIPLTLLAFVLALALSLVIGFVSAWKADRWYGAALSAFSQLGIAVPVFWLGILLIDVFAIHLRVFPSGGFPPDNWANPAAALNSLVLPVITIAIVMSAALARYVRSATLGVLGSDYLRTARALGSPFIQAMWRHGIRNGAVPVIAVLGIELATTFLGAVVVEAVFALPGLGSMLLRAIQQHDYPNMQGILLTATLIVLLVGFAADVVQRLVDPRQRQSISRK